MPLNLSRIAYGCSSIAELEASIAMRAVDGKVMLTTRYRPKRAAEMEGGSLYWIVRHQLVARGAILGFAEAEGGRTNIILAARVIAVHPYPRRAHQGWRYLAEADAPPDLDFGAAGDEPLPAALVAELSEAGLF